MKTLTEAGVRKILEGMRGSLSHAAYLEDGVECRINIFRADITDNQIKIFVFLDDTVTGKISELSLVDRAGDVIATAHRAFTKEDGKGAYCVFSYSVVEVEDTDVPIIGGDG